MDIRATDQQYNPYRVFTRRQWSHLRDLIDNDGRYTPHPVGDLAEGLAVIQYTGGTTGSPKGAMLTHANLTAACSLYMEIMTRSGPDSLREGEGLWIVPCEAVHTFAMRFAIDLVYLDRHHRVVKTRSNVRPWRISGSLRAHSVLELAAGVIEQTRTAPGDRLKLEFRS